LEAGNIARIVESIVGMVVEYKKARMAFGERRGYRSTIRAFILLLYLTIKP
jgi:hypothetical protein